ncbi:hypothetical protein KEM55_007382 [Ascosphaera atra]|nr:hypothetical protein KEM55_007382 [Ascosphaera atra]
MPSFAGSDSPELQRMGLGKGGDAGTSPGLAVNGGRLNRKLDSLFHDVSGGVAKAVKGAVGEARRNFNAAGQHGSVGGTVSQFRRSGNSIASGLSPSNPNAFAMSELNKKVFALENRSKALGAMLSGVLSEFKAAQRKQQEEAEKKEKGGEKGEKEGAGTEAKPDAMTQATDLLLAKVQFVQVYLEDPTIPIGDADTLGPDTGSPFTVAGSEWDKLSPRSNSVAIDSPNDPFVLAAESPENLARRSPGIGLSKETSRTSEPRNVSNLDGSTDTKSPIKSPSPSTPAKDHRSRPSQTRPVSHTRAPLSESPFSWMLGESKDTRPGGFSPLHTPSRSVAGSTSASPAMASPSAERRRHGSLFGDVDDGDDGKDTMSKHARGSSLNKLGLE